MPLRVTVWFFGVLMTLAFSQPLGAQSPAPQDGPPDLYFLAIGIGNFADGGAEELEASAQSAEVVARALIGAGARFGYVMVSRPGDGVLITREDVRTALAQLKARIRADAPASPRIVVYIMSHGVGDGAGRQTYLLTDDLIILDPKVSQRDVYRLGRRAVWSIDILASLMNFRLDPFFEELDTLLEADLFSDRVGFMGTIEHAQNIAARDRQLAESRAQLGSRQVNNAPVPFVLLMDNCAYGVAADLVEPNRYLDALTEQYYRATLDVGVAFQAAPFGVGAPVLPLPSSLAAADDLIEARNGAGIAPWVGPMAVHLKTVLAERDPTVAMSLTDLAGALASAGSDLPESGLPSTPVQLPSYLRDDVGSVLFLPALSGPFEGTFEYLVPGGGDLQLCCSEIGSP